MPTRAGLGTLAISALVLVGARLFGIFELYIVAVAMIALVGAAMLWVFLNWRSLHVSRIVDPPRLHAGSESLVTLNLTNNRLWPTPVVQIVDEVAGEVRADAHVPPLQKNQVTRASYRVPTPTRGMIPLGPMTTKVTDPFGLAGGTRHSAPDGVVLVLPAYDDITAPAKPGGQLGARENRTAGRLGPHGDEFSSLRPYVRGDDMRKVHWPTTARSDDLVVRTELVPEDGHSLVILDVRATIADGAAFEQMVSAATSVVIACRKRGDTVRLVTTANEAFTADSDVSLAHLLDRLAVIGQSTGPSAQLTASSDTSTTETAVLLIGDDASFIEKMHRESLPSSTSVVKFTERRATPHGARPALRSRRMVTVGPNDRFADVWQRAAGPASPSSPAPAASSTTQP